MKSKNFVIQAYFLFNEEKKNLFCDIKRRGILSNMQFIKYDWAVPKVGVNPISENAT